MSYKIVVDSACDLTEDMKTWDNFEIVPLTLQINDYIVVDSPEFNHDEFFEKLKANNGNGKSACPAPSAFANAFEGDYDDVYVITITDKLSGSYNSALQGKGIYEEEHDDNKNIHVFNSLATSGTLILIAKKIKELADGGMAFDDVVSTVEDFIINHTSLYFCLESMDALKSNGRLFALAAKLVEKIKVKLICKAVDGNISPCEKDFNINRAMVKLANLVIKKLDGVDMSNQSMIVSYVCSPDRAELVANRIKDSVNFGNVEIVRCNGLNSFYALTGGILVAFTY